ncbi:zinc-binding metallopeptidase family protein [Mycobacterium spongiae]|uniref:zinc-binding metallopeptidase family protein n=1 Tax=Mycobacterium spongiae TaxID=886343 RepID=UPI002484CAF4|nr:putative zinc-binding metallopeptidase [Mycobacterium spongiae]
MRAFRCPECRQPVGFEVQRCLACGTAVGYHYPSRQMLSVSGRAGVVVDERQWVRCSHWERGCNWLTAGDCGGGRCFPDSFVRRSPAPDDSEALGELDNTLKALRRLIFQLMDLGLPVRPYYQAEDGLAFDLLSSKSLGGPVMIGHANGVITIDLDESVELYRERLRIRLKEPYRTMLGHFRHEVGHYYEMILVQDTPLAEHARAMFGDEREDYQAALQRHYSGVVPPDWQSTYISEYATAHPWEDFAETFAHYLHITGTLATIADSGLVLQANRVTWDLKAEIDARVSYADATIADIIGDWMPLSSVLNRVNHSMGRDDLYPFSLPPRVVDKLGFIHQVVTTTAVDHAAARQG